MSLITTHVTNYCPCNRFSFLLRILVLVTNSGPCHGFSFWSRILIRFVDSRSCHGFLWVARILVLVKDYCSCHGFSFLLQIIPLATHHRSGHWSFVLLCIISRLSLNVLYCPTPPCCKFTILPTPLMSAIPMLHTEMPSSSAHRTCPSQFNLIAPTYMYLKSYSIHQKPQSHYQQRRNRGISQITPCSHTKKHKPTLEN